MNVGLTVRIYIHKMHVMPAEAGIQCLKSLDPS